ncbi:pyridoxal phosphate-dependent aminotransferase [Burkholderia pseudomallei]|uniref:pyridoxal phosphate-dependent aminotransferase n=1 Tax=Burkholderia pseudomallei TaxID=28450 RepID=UPI0009784058|nr:histidinol-phosphate transaminase [Burkholderia pseudomallei]
MNQADHELGGLIDRIPSYIRTLPRAPVADGMVAESAHECIKLDLNENPCGMSTRVRGLLNDPMTIAQVYPDPKATRLTLALAAFHGVAAQEIVIGNGSNDVLDLICRALVAPGSKAVISDVTFSVYPNLLRAVGAQQLLVGVNDYWHDLAGLTAASRAGARIVIVDNPHNPMGTYLKPDAIANFVRSVPADTFVVLDEAYIDYVDPRHQTNVSELIRCFPNLIVVRTFSKGYGLGGFRIGYGVMHRIVADFVRRVRQPYCTNSLGLMAAEIALADQEFVATVRKSTRRSMDELHELLDGLHVPHSPSQCCFAFARFEDAERISGALRNRGVIVKELTAYGTSNALRISLGNACQNAVLHQALLDVVTGGAA